jgi:hypothetical protein
MTAQNGQHQRRQPSEKVAAIPSSIGKPLLTTGWSALAKTKGSAPALWWAASTCL